MVSPMGPAGNRLQLTDLDIPILVDFYKLTVNTFAPRHAINLLRLMIPSKDWRRRLLSYTSSRVTQAR